jgi:hypothetical protein
MMILMGADHYPVNMGLVVNLAEHSVSGGEDFLGIVTRIDEGEQAFPVSGGVTIHITGTINRVTGATRITRANNMMSR